MSQDAGATVSLMAEDARADRSGTGTIAKWSRHQAARRPDWLRIVPSVKGDEMIFGFKDAADTRSTQGARRLGDVITQSVKTAPHHGLTEKPICPCFTPGTMIATPRGEVPVETLRVGDQIVTRDNGVQEIRWLGKQTLSREVLARDHTIKPILIMAGSLGDNLPERDMVVSPQHRVLITGEPARRHFDEAEVFVAATHLTNATGIKPLETLRVTYLHFMFDQHQVVMSDGAWTESFQPADKTLGALGQAAHDEILALFPALATADGVVSYVAARRTLNVEEAQLLQL
jgi:hypothetical protein